MAVLQKAYAYTSFLTIALGFMVGLLYVVAFIVGGSAGEEISLFSQAAMTWGIRLASLAVLFGIVYIYISKEHSLTMDSDKEDLKKIEEIVEPKEEKLGDFTV
ncbi:hypothetical protein ACQKKK_16265 [Peribacillus sp. NPDC006672]|uniref:hypothetical protein n=1 Tax=Peribacillus sp. NPDC006672 TaxID=3390606 RepID=UPI003D00D33A